MSKRTLSEIVRELRPKKPAEDRLFKRGECNLRLNAIKLSDPTAGPTSENPPVQILRCGKFNHPKYGEFEITPVTLAEMKANFEAGVRGVDLAVDYFHESDKEAAAWFDRLYLAEDGTELWAEVRWTKRAQTMLGEREVRYFSPDFAFQWTDPESGVTYRNVLFGGGLTNRPFVKDMAAIVAHEQEGTHMNEEEKKQFKAMQEAIIKLSEAVAPPAPPAPAKPAADDMAARKAAKAKLKAQLAEYDDVPEEDEQTGKDGESDDIDVEDLKKQLADAQASNKKLLAEKAAAEEAKKMAEKTAEFNVMLSEGKACAAQKDAFMKGDVVAFAKLAQPINLSERGSTGDSGAGGGEDRAERVLKLAEEKVKADPKLKLVDAISLAQKEIPKA